VSDELNEAQERIFRAGDEFEVHARTFEWTQQGAATLALVEVVRQIGIEMLAGHTTIYEMESAAEELAAPETLYTGGEAVTSPVTASDLEHYCQRERRVVGLARRACPHEECAS
jgi:hypothetical protein